MGSILDKMDHMPKYSNEVRFNSSVEATLKTTPQPFLPPGQGADEF